MKPTVTCPACGYITLSDENYGSYDLCEVCGWEDDPFQLINPFNPRGPQCISLSDYQKRNTERLVSEIFTKDLKWLPVKDCEIDLNAVELELSEIDKQKRIDCIIPYWRKL